MCVIPRDIYFDPLEISISKKATKESMMECWEKARGHGEVWISGGLAWTVQLFVNGRAVVVTWINGRDYVLQESMVDSFPSLGFFSVFYAYLTCYYAHHFQHQSSITAITSS